MAQRVAELLAAARAAGLTVWAEGDHLVVRGPARAEKLARELHEHAPAVLALLASTELRAVFPGPDGAPTAPCSLSREVVRLRRSEREGGWLWLDCPRWHRCYIKLADHADWLLRQLSATTDPIRPDRAFTAAVVTTA